MLKHPGISFNLKKLQYSNVAETIKDNVKDINCDVDALARNIKEVLLSTVQEVLGFQRKKKQQKVMNDSLDLNDQRMNPRGRK